MRASLSFPARCTRTCSELIQPRFLLSYLGAIILHPLAPAHIASLMCSTTRQELDKRLFLTAAHLSRITLMVLTHLLFQLFLSPFRRLCAFLGRPLMTNLRDSIGTQ
jgi:hypothetical protein